VRKRRKLRRHIWRRVIAGHRSCTRSAARRMWWDVEGDVLLAGRVLAERTQERAHFRPFCSLELAQCHRCQLRRSLPVGKNTFHASIQRLPPPQVHWAECQLGCSEPTELARNSRRVASGDAVAWLSGSCPTAHGADCALQFERRFDMRAGLYWRSRTTVVVPSRPPEPSDGDSGQAKESTGCFISRVARRVPPDWQHPLDEHREYVPFYDGVAFLGPPRTGWFTQ
jgi:hypothetical protein